jgi:hypothetical protein
MTTPGKPLLLILPAKGASETSTKLSSIAAELAGKGLVGTVVAASNSEKNDGPVKFIKPEAGGTLRKRAIALAAMEGAPVIVIVSDDVLLPENFVERAIDALNADPRLVAAIGFRPFRAGAQAAPGRWLVLAARTALAIVRSAALLRPAPDAVVGACARRLVALEGTDLSGTSDEDAFELDLLAEGNLHGDAVAFLRVETESDSEPPGSSQPGILAGVIGRLLGRKLRGRLAPPPEPAPGKTPKKKRPAFGTGAKPR